MKLETDPNEDKIEEQKERIPATGNLHQRFRWAVNLYLDPSGDCVKDLVGLGEVQRDHLGLHLVLLLNLRRNSLQIDFGGVNTKRKKNKKKKKTIIISFEFQIN